MNNEFIINGVEKTIYSNLSDTQKQGLKTEILGNISTVLNEILGDES